MSSINLDKAKLVNEWNFSKIPSDIVSLTNANWAVFCSSKAYFELNKIDTKLHEKAANEELYRVESAQKEGYFIATYDAIARQTKVWKTASVDLSNKELLGVEDPTNIAYSIETGQLYWISQSRKLMVYNPKTKESTSFSADYSVSNFSIASNGKFLGIEDTDRNLFMINLQNEELVLEKKSISGDYFSLVGVTDEAKFVLLNSKVTTKNATKKTISKVLLYDGKTENILLEDTISWAQLLGNQLAAWGDGKLKIYEL